MTSVVTAYSDVAYSDVEFVSSTGVEVSSVQAFIGGSSGFGFLNFLKTLDGQFSEMRDLS